MANQNMYQDINPESIQVGDSVYGLAGIRDMQNLFRRDQLRQEQDKQIARSNRMKDLDEAQRVATQPGLLDAAGAQNILSAGDRARAPQQVTNATDELGLKQAGTQNKFVEEMLGGLVDLAGKNPEAAQELYANISADGIDHPLQKGLQEKLRSAGLLKPSGNPMLGNRADLSRDLPVLQSLIGSVRDKNKVLAGTASNAYKADQNLAGINRKAEATEYGADVKGDVTLAGNELKASVEAMKLKAKYDQALALKQMDYAMLRERLSAGLQNKTTAPQAIKTLEHELVNILRASGSPEEYQARLPWVSQEVVQLRAASASLKSDQMGAYGAPTPAQKPIPKNVGKTQAPAQTTVTPPTERNGQGPSGPVQIKSEAEWKALAPGTKYITPDGRPAEKK
jgi:hypothetical protein